MMSLRAVPRHALGNPMLPTPTESLWMLVLPTLLAAVAMLAARPWRRGRDLPGFASAIAIGGAFIVSFAGWYETPRFPPLTAETWLVYLASVVIVIAILQAVIRGRAFGLVASSLVVLITPWLLLRKLPLEPRAMWTWSIGAGLGMVTWWLAMEALARRSRAGVLAAILALVIGISGLAVINAHSRQLGMLTGALAFPLLIVALAAAWSGGASLARGGILALAVLLLGLLLGGRFFADLSTRDMALLAVAPLAAWAGEIPGLGKANSRKRIAVRIVAVLAICALPAFDAAKGVQETLREQTESYQY
jgi:hypothetical protein